MRFNDHSELADKHAFLSPSSYHWVNYTEEKLTDRYETVTASALGTRLHAFAAEAIELGIRLPKNGKTLNTFVNDAIGWRMTPEQPLFYSFNAFGTADAISFRRDILRIFDLKTGRSKASLMQLKVYAALFCLEYGVRPAEIDYDLRIYQNDSIIHEDVDPTEIAYVIDRIVTFDKRIDAINSKKNR